MKKTDEHIANNSFLKKGLEQSIENRHQEYLGTDIPEDYFKKSKLSIMDAIAKAEENKEEEKPVTKVIKIQPRIWYAIAASLVFLLSLTVWLQNAKSDVNGIENDFEGVELFSSTEDVLLNSLFIEDSELESYADNVLVNEVLIKAELSEQKLEEVFLNSLFVEDSLIDNYTNENLIENLIL